MKISIITPSLNQGNYIKDCIESVINQNYNNFEHIIIDGDSDDNTFEVINNYNHLRVVREKDSGPASAINKGFKLASGEIVAWLNADDYYDSNVLQKINSVFEENPKVEFVYGNLTFVNEKKNILFRDKSKSFSYDSLINKSPDIRQPSSFYKTDLIKKVKYLDEDLKIVFDYDLFIKMAKISEPFYTDENISFYRDYPDTITRKNVRKQALEIWKVSMRHGGKLISPITKLVLYRLIKGVL